MSYQLLNPVHLLNRPKRVPGPRLQLYLGEEQIKIRLKLTKHKTKYKKKKTLERNRKTSL